VIFDDHQFGTEMPSGGHPPHQLAASFISGSYTGLYRGMLEGIAERFVRGMLMRQPTTGEMRTARNLRAVHLQALEFKT